MKKTIIITTLLILIFCSIATADWVRPQVNAFWDRIGNTLYPANITDNINTSGTYYGDGSGLTGIIAASTAWNRTPGRVWPRNPNDIIDLNNQTMTGIKNQSFTRAVSGNIQSGSILPIMAGTDTFCPYVANPSQGGA